MGEPELDDVVDKLLGLVGVAAALTPGAEVHLVDAHRPLGGRLRRALGQPGFVAPVVAGGEHDRRRARRVLGRERQWVGLVPPYPVGAVNVVLVAGALGHLRHEELPDATAAARPHSRSGAVPAVEVADDPNLAGVGRPHRERRAGRGIGAGVDEVAAERLPQLFVASLTEQVQVDLAERGAAHPVASIAGSAMIRLSEPSGIGSQLGRFCCS
jgi:hypothetical protein